MIIVIRTDDKKPSSVATATCVYVGSKPSEAKTAAAQAGEGVYHFYYHANPTMVKTHSSIAQAARIAKAVAATPPPEPAPPIEEPTPEPKRRGRPRKAADPAPTPEPPSPEAGSMAAALLAPPDPELL
jgi:hypothetical protein